MVEPDDTAVSVDECDVEREPHEEHVDGAARPQVEARAVGELALAQSGP